MKVAGISFNDNNGISMDLEGVTHIGTGAPMDLGDGRWFMELLVRTTTGIVALQLVSDSPDKLVVEGVS